MRIVFAGTPAAAVPSLEALLASGHDVIAVLTRPDAPTGRGRKLVASPVATIARDAGIEVLAPSTSRDPALLHRLQELGPDAAAVVAYGAILRPDLLAVPTHGWINLHFSLLPAWRGAAPVQAAIAAGDDITGATTFLLEAGLDTGPVYGTVTEPIGPRDTAGALLERLSSSGARLLVATLDGIADGSLTAVPQPAEGVSTAGKISVADAQINWTWPAIAIDRHIRSVTPAPGAWTDAESGRLVLGPIDPAPADVTAADVTPADAPAADPITDGAAAGHTGHPRLAPGELQVTKRQVLVGTGSTPVALGTVQPTGRRPMPAADWARGVRPRPGAAFGPATTRPTPADVETRAR